MEKPLFGTDGIRTKVGSYPFTTQSLPHLGTAIAHWACTKYGHTPRIIIAGDTRESRLWMHDQLVKGLLSYPVHVYESGILPTPVLYWTLYHKSDFDLGIIITASHNPYHDNGIKIIDAEGKISADDEHQITQLMSQQLYTDNTTVGSQTALSTIEEKYIEAIMQLFPNNMLKNLTIVLDCAHGAWYRLAPLICQEFGAHVIVINNKPTGRNINHRCGSQHPEMIQQTIQAHQADIGFAFDGDGDRVIMVSADGTVYDGDHILALLLQHPVYEKESTVVGTIMSNEGLAHYLETKNKQLIRTPVGDKQVATALAQHQLKLGGEPSGHIILRDFLPTSDGLFTALRIMQTRTYSKNFSTFQSFPQYNTSITVQEKRDLSQPPLASLIEEHQAKLYTGRLVVRYSGTQNVLRIMVEDQDKDHVYHVGTQLAKKLTQQLKSR